MNVKTSRDFAESAVAMAEPAARLLRLMGNPVRLRILCELMDAERNVGALTERLGLEQSALSQHLARLRRDDLVRTRREAQTIYYTLASEEVARLIELLHELYCAPAQAAGRSVAKTPEP